MAYTKEILTGVGALACAIGIGFVMQESGTAEKLYGNKAPAPSSMATPVEDATTNALLDVQQITLTSAEFENAIALPDTDTEVTRVAAPASTLDAPDVPEAALAHQPACNITATARPVAAAMVDLSLQASCLPNERVTVHHNGMIFTETTSAEGTVDLTLPALTRDAVFILAFSNGEGAVAQTTVEDIGDYNRAVLQWKGKMGFEIHALEFGATYGAAGHLWAGAPGSIAGAVLGESGVMTRHGDINAADPLLAEVYTFPKAASDQSGLISLSVETEITEMNCGIEIEAQSLELQGDRTIRTRNLTLPVPECDAKNSFLVLNNLLQDLKVAAK